jgi:putative nucleotidyltransferase with HDIG domain
MNASGTGGSSWSGNKDEGKLGSLKGAGKKPIGEMLIDAGLLARAQLNEGLRIQADRGGKLVQILISLGYIDPPAFIRFLAQQPGVASLDLSSYEVPQELVALVPREFAILHEVFPIDRLGKLLTLGMVCPLDSKTIGELESKTGLRVKPLLCSAEDVRRAIARYYPSDDFVRTGGPSREATLAGLETSLKLGSVTGLIRNIESLPTLPETVNKIREAMTSPECSMEDVANIITNDPPIAAKVLSVANSAAFGFANRINTVRLAVSLLGLRELYSIVLTASIINRSEQNSKHFDYNRFWSHSMACAAACKVVAQVSGNARLTSVPTAGLLHDLGIMALLEVSPDLYAKVDPNLAGDELIAAEEELIGLNHAEAGFELATHWGLPPDISEAIRFHHHPEYAGEAKIVAAIVAVGDLLFRFVESGEPASPELFEPYTAYLQMLDLTPNDGANLLRTCAEQRVADARNGKAW